MRRRLPMREFVSSGALAAMVAALGPAAAASGEVIYVDAKAKGAGTGTSWADAFTALPPALAASVAGDEIWVAATTYTSAPPNGPRTATLTLKPEVALYGGFAGDESKLDQRDWIGNPTTLSGDLNGNDGAPPAPGQPFINNAENVLHVVTALHPGAAAVIDGFTIAGGNANQSLHLFGGGLNVRRPASIDVRNCTFIANRAQLGGGAIAFTGNSDVFDSTAVISDCTFYRNSADANGGAIHRSGDGEQLLHINRCTFVENRTTDSDVIGGGAVHSDFSFQFQLVENCIFTGNQSQVGSAIGIYSSSVTVRNCLLTGNHCRAGGYAVLMNFGNAPITNCTIVGNTTQDGSSGGIAHGSAVNNCIIRGNTGPQFYNSNDATVQYCNVEGGWPGPGTGNIDADPLFVDSAAGNLHLLPASPCIDVGNNTAASGVSVDLDGNPRIVDGDDDGSARVDIGAFEHQPQPPGDINGDGVVDVNDLLILIGAWGSADPGADLNDDGIVDVNDLLLLIGNWG